MKNILTAAVCTLMSVSLPAAGKVTVEKLYEDKVFKQIEVPAGKFARLPLGKYRPGDKIAVVLDVKNAVYKDITACIAWGEAAANSYRPGAQCNGYRKAVAPFVLKAEPPVPAELYLILDNSYAAVIHKHVLVNTVFQAVLPDEQVKNLEGVLSAIHGKISETFRDSDIDIRMKTCGERNAYSEVRTAAITVCTELVTDLLKQGNTGALVGIILHEYGHSLLNRWGEPGSSEEDMADQFAAAFLLREGDKGRQMVMQWIDYWKARDSVGEARVVLQRGDTHTLSVQRARNLQQILNLPEDFSRRWNKMMYRHMTDAELDRVLQKPSKSDDIDLAQQAKARAL